MLVQGLLFFFFKIFLFTSTGFSSQWMHPSLQQSEAASNGFFQKTIFLQNPILELSNEIVPVKELQVQSSLKINSFKGMFLKFGDSIRM